MRRDMGVGLAIAALLVAAIVAGPPVWRAARALPRVARALAHRADQRVVTLEVAGMTCPNCAAKVGGELERVPGVTAARVRLDRGEVIVVCDRPLADSLLTEAVERAGPGYRALISSR